MGPPKLLGACLSLTPYQPSLFMWETYTCKEPPLHVNKEQVGFFTQSGGSVKVGSDALSLFTAQQRGQNADARKWYVFFLRRPTNLLPVTFQYDGEMQAFGCFRVTSETTRHQEFSGHTWSDQPPLSCWTLLSARRSVVERNVPRLSKRFTVAQTKCLLVLSEHWVWPF